jgi:hypothetical protein
VGAEVRLALGAVADPVLRNDLVTGGGFDTDNVDIKASGPNGNNGWYVRADGGLEGGSVTLSVMCLHLNH